MYEAFPAEDSAIAFVAGRFADHRLSFTEDELRSRYPAVTPAQAEHIIELLLDMDRIEQAPFAANADERLWTSRSVAKRLIRLTIEQARKQAEPIDPIRWCTHMSLLQHALPGTQLSGTDGLRTVIGSFKASIYPLPTGNPSSSLPEWLAIARRISICCAPPARSSGLDVRRRMKRKGKSPSSSQTRSFFTCLYAGPSSAQSGGHAPPGIRCLLGLLTDGRRKLPDKAQP